MTGLDLVTFLRLLRTDLAAWTGLALAASILALSVWTSIRGRRLLRRCVAISLLAHVAALTTGGRTTWGQQFLSSWDLSRLAEANRPESPERLAPIELAAEPEASLESPRDDGLASEASSAEAAAAMGTAAGAGAAMAPWDRPSLRHNRLIETLMSRAERPESDASPALPAPITRPAPEAAVTVTARNPALEAPAVARPEEPVEAVAASPSAIEPAPESVAAVAPGELPTVSRPATATAAAVDPLAALRSSRSAVSEPRAGRAVAAQSRPVAPSAAVPLELEPSLPLGPLVALGEPPTLGLPTGEGEGAADRLMPPLADGPGGLGPTDLEALGRALSGEATGAAVRQPSPPLAMPGPERLASRPAAAAAAREAPALRPSAIDTPVTIARAMPDSVLSRPAIPRVSVGPRALPEVPNVYRPRLDRDRSVRAQRAGASAASEQAVERALDWLARHQDEDGRWDAATGVDSQGRPARGHDDFTKHCPPGEICFGTCHYHEADSAITGLALLAYLGAGYTHLDGKHATTVARGLDYLKGVQKPDGDLRGISVAVGMYCHSMAALALCEAYALTGDPALREPAARAVDFLVRSRARDNMAWRYEPAAAVGDTSILGWVILVLKSGHEVGFTIPQTMATGSARWLRHVAAGERGGLAFYQPGYPVTPTMTAEAWVCRQFLGIGGPGAASDEAAAYLLKYPPDHEFNIYYYYYATIAMFQRGGADWTRWNGLMRDALVSRQRTSGHMAGSWDPDDSKYGQYGGRVYTTALATLTLEVYYRYLRLYDDAPAPAPPAASARAPR